MRCRQIIHLRLQLFFIAFIVSSPGFAAGNPGDPEKFPGNSWHLLVGAGSSQPGWGGTREKVKTTDIILRQKRPQARTRGESWYLNRKSVLVEIPLTLLREPDEPAMIGFTMNVNWTFIANQQLQPFILIGGGPVYTKAEIPGTSSRLKGSYQLGAGLDFKLGEVGMSLEWRYHHLSNGGFKEPNDPLNSSKFLLGFKLPF
ncbi:MAG: acyloxyacyl hydrolase [Pseudomonadota bacterium]|nr:acyloxyacyl hydrolase [Pseudomonadota bacterium]